MPFVSDAQRRWGHTQAGMQALGGPAKVKEWDQATKGKTLPMHKQTSSGVGAYAKGGPVLGRSENWMKSPDRFRTSGGGKDIRNVVEETEDQYPKSGAGGKLSKTSGDSKSLTPVKPRT